MIDRLTPAERRGAMMLVVILLAGAGWDEWRALRPGSRGPEPHADAPGPARQAEPDGASASLPASAVESMASGAGRAVLDLNRASAADLDALPGIGPVLAGRIVAHRERLGRFRRVEDLLSVRGVGPRLFERLRGRIGAADPAAGVTDAHSARRGPAGRADSTSVPVRPSR